VYVDKQIDLPQIGSLESEQHLRRITHVGCSQYKATRKDVERTDFFFIRKPNIHTMKTVLVKQNVGIDISKDDFHVCFIQLTEDQRQRIKASRQFKNTLSGFKQFQTWVDKHKANGVTVRLTLEATGVYYEQLVHFLNDNTDYHISVVLPNKSKAFSKSLNVKTKTDKVDAKVLGRMGLERNLERWQPISPKMLTIKYLCRERVSLLEEKTAISNRQHALNHSHNPHKDSLKRNQKRMQFIEQQIKQVEKQIAQAVEKDEDLKERIDNVCQIKGLGLITVATIVAETGAFDLFTSRAQVTGFAGYDVVENQSGTSLKGKTRISKRGNKYIRRALYFPAITAVEHEAQFKQLYDRVFEKTGIKMKGYVAVQRKLLLIIYTLFSKNLQYDSTYKTKNSEKKVCRQTQEPAYAG
jgi:transposase